MKLNSMERIGYIDSLRGFAILLVVVGHLIQYNYSSFLDSCLFNVIYSFHMPLFFFISGCVRALHGDGKINLRILSIRVLNRFCALIIPSVVWSSIVPLFFLKLTDLSWHLTSGYWFLNVLFVVSLFWECFLYFDTKLSKKWILYGLSLLVLLLLFILGIKRIPVFYLSMFIFGFYFQRYQWIDKINCHIYGILLFLFLIGVGNFRYGFNVEGDAARIWYQMPLSVCASLCLMKLFSLLDSKSYRLSTCLGFIGKFTLGIYLAHFIFVEFGNFSFLETSFTPALQFVLLISMAVLISALCILIQHVIKPFGWLYGVMYGKLNFFK